jgi:hypothetical protein
MVRTEPATGSRASPNEEYGPHKTLYNRWKRWSEKGVFAQILMGLATEEPVETTVMIDATDLKTHRAATSLRVKKGDEPLCAFVELTFPLNQGRLDLESSGRV